MFVYRGEDVQRHQQRPQRVCMRLTDAAEYALKLPGLLNKEACIWVERSRQKKLGLRLLSIPLLWVVLVLTYCRQFACFLL